MKSSCEIWQFVLLIFGLCGKATCFTLGDLKSSSFFGNDDTQQLSTMAENNRHARDIRMVGLQPSALFSKPKGVIDLRDDSATHPSQSMRKAMGRATVGNDVYGEPSGVLTVEAKCTSMLNKEAGLFLPSETMANLVAIMAWCTQRGSEFICGDLSHIYQNEQAGPAQFGGVSPRPLRNLPDGTLALSDVEFAIRPNDIAQPVTRLVTLENTHLGCGGRILSTEYTDAVGNLAEEYGLRVHLDGTRLWNAQCALGLEDPSRLCAGADSVTVSLSHGLGAPAGAILAGPSEFIARARRLRQGLGGQMNQGAQFLAVAGLEAVEKMIPRLVEDHQQALSLAKELNQIQGLTIDESTIQTNVLLATVDNSVGLSAKEVVEKLKQNDILVTLVGPKCIRMITHYEVTQSNVKKVIEVFTKIFETYGSERGYIPEEINASVKMESSDPFAESFEESLPDPGPSTAGPEASPPITPVREPYLEASPLQEDTNAENNIGSIEEEHDDQDNAAKIEGKFKENLGNSTDFYEMPWARPKIKAETDQTANLIVDTVVTSNYSSAVEDIVDDTLAGPLQNITARDYEEVAFFGASVSPEGFTVVLTNSNQTRALRLVVTPSDPMSAGVDVSDPESPEALTILQLMQGIDVGSHLPPDALEIKLGLDVEKEAWDLPFVLMTDVSEGTFRAKLVVVRELEDICPPEVEDCNIYNLSIEQKEFLIEAVTSNSFEAIALALRYDAKIYTKTKSLHPSSGLSFDASQIEAKYPKIVEAQKAARAKFMTDQFDPEAEAVLLKKRLKDAIISGDFEKVQLLQRQLKVYDTAAVDDPSKSQ